MQLALAALPSSNRQPHPPLLGGGAFHDSDDPSVFMSVVWAGMSPPSKV